MLLLRPGVAEVSRQIGCRASSAASLSNSDLFLVWQQWRNRRFFLFGSADWMPATSTERVEAWPPVDGSRLRAQLERLLEPMSPNLRAWDILQKRRQLQQPPTEGEPHQCQARILNQETAEGASCGLSLIQDPGAGMGCGPGRSAGDQ